jgi:5-methylcytosine-specific restriction enzyme subunit McrC
MRIPILNVYYLLCYAWNQLEEGEAVSVGLSDSHDLKDLLARVLDNGVRHLIRRGLDRGYVTHAEELQGIRGKIDFPASLRRASFERGRAACQFDELSYDVPHNRIVKATLRTLARTEGLDSATRDALAASYARLSAVRDAPISPADFGRVQLDRNRRHYELLLNVCRLVYESLLIDEQSGQRVFRDFLRDERRMASLFQNFVKNFYQREQARYDVSSMTLPWHDAAWSEGAEPYLPDMHTDVTLEARDRTIIIDAKYYTDVFDRPYGRPKVRSSHLYQVFTYAYNYRQATGRPVEGVLLYPTVSEAVDLRFQLSGFAIRVRTVDLSQDWREIRDELLGLLN